MIWKIVDFLEALLGIAFALFFVGLLLCGVVQDVLAKYRKKKAG